MELKQQNRILIIGVLILLIANLATISAIWFNKTNQPEESKLELIQKKYRYNGRHLPRSIFYQELELNESQISIAKQMQKDHFKKIRIIKDSIRYNKHKIHEELFKDNPDTVYINKLTNTIGSLNSHLEKLNYQHFSVFKNYLKPEQKTKLKQIMDDASYRGDKRNHNRGYHQKRVERKEQNRN